MIVLGITGGIGSGKSVVSRLFALNDIPVYYADLESKLLLDSSLSLRKELIRAFGEKLYGKGQIDRALFASIIFSDPQKLQQANEIIHPFVKDHFLQWVESNREAGKSLVAKEAAILYESGFDKFVDKVLLVYAPLEMRLARAMARDRASREQILARMKHQMPDEEKLKKADIVIVNDDRVSVIDQVTKLLKSFQV